MMDLWDSGSVRDCLFIDLLFFIIVKFIWTTVNSLFNIFVGAPRTQWTPPMDRYLVDLLVVQVNKGNRNGKSFVAQAWLDMIRSFNSNFGIRRDKDVLKNRYKQLKKQYDDITTILGEKGFYWDDKREMVAAKDHVWDAYIEVTKFYFPHFRG